MHLGMNVLAKDEENWRYLADVFYVVQEKATREENEYLEMILFSKTLLLRNEE